MKNPVAPPPLNHVNVSAQETVCVPKRTEAILTFNEEICIVCLLYTNLICQINVIHNELTCAESRIINYRIKKNTLYNKYQKRKKKIKSLPQFQKKLNIINLDHW